MLTVTKRSSSEDCEKVSSKRARATSKPKVKDARAKSKTKKIPTIKREPRFSCSGILSLLNDIKRSETKSCDPLEKFGGKCESNFNPEDEYGVSWELRRISGGVLNRRGLCEEDRDLYYYVKEALKFPFHGKLQLPDGEVADCRVSGLFSQSPVPGRKANFWFDVWVEDTKGEGHVICVPSVLLSYCKVRGKPAVARYVLNDLRYFFSIATLAHSRVAEDVMGGCFYDAGSCFDDDQKKAWTLYYQHRSKRHKPAVDMKGTEELTAWLRLDKLYSCGYPMGKEVEGLASYLSAVADFPFKAVTCEQQEVEVTGVAPTDDTSHNIGLHVMVRCAGIPADQVDSCLCLPVEELTPADSAPELVKKCFEDYKEWLDRATAYRKRWFNEIFKCLCPRIRASMFTKTKKDTDATMRNVLEREFGKEMLRGMSGGSDSESDSTED